VATCSFCAEALPQPTPAKCPSCGERLVAPRGPAPAPLPKGPQILGWLDIAFGAMGLFGPVVFVVTQTFLPKTPGDPMQAAMAASAFFRGWIYFGQVLGLACSALLLSAGVGLLRWRDWARRASIAYAWFIIALTPITIAINVRYLSPAMVGANLGPLPPEFFMITTTCASLVGLVFPVATLLVLRRPVVLAVFAEQERLRAQGLT
jgi:hypothetical protein